MCVCVCVCACVPEQESRVKSHVHSLTFNHSVPCMKSTKYKVTTALANFSENDTFMIFDIRRSAQPIRLFEQSDIDKNR